MMTKAKGKERQRYILVHYIIKDSHDNEFNSNDTHAITEKTLWKTISRTHSALHGDFKSAYSGLYIMVHDPSIQLFILRTSLYALTDVVTTLTMITKMGGTPCVMWPIKITGTLKKGKKIMSELSSRITIINQELRNFLSTSFEQSLHAEQHEEN